jgi:hypothetical protein
MIVNEFKPWEAHSPYCFPRGPVVSGAEKRLPAVIAPVSPEYLAGNASKGCKVAHAAPVLSWPLPAEGAKALGAEAAALILGILKDASRCEVRHSAGRQNEIHVLMCGRDMSRVRARRSSKRRKGGERPC